jgi:vancomycin resistance protein YoaR
MSNKIIDKSRKYLLKFGLSAYFIIMAAFIGFHLYYANRILPNIYVDNINLGGLTFSEAENLLSSKLKPNENGFKLKLNSYETAITPESIQFELLPISTAKKAFLIGRSGSFSTNLKNKILAILNPIIINPEYRYDDSVLKSLVDLAKIEGLDEVREPYYFIEGDELKIASGKQGEMIDSVETEKTIIKQLVYAMSTDIEPEISIVNPTLNMQDLIKLKFDVESILNKKYSLVYKDRKWEIDKVALLSFVKPVKKNTQAVLIVDKSVILDRLNEVGTQINRNPRGQILVVENGKAASFSSPEEGLRLVIKDSFDAVEKSIFDKTSTENNEKNIALVVEVTAPPETPNEYKIEDVLGIGTSKFKGSDAGRMHNIENASGKVNGVLVEPGGVFSFVEAVGPIDRNNGFTSAKVISGGRTVLGDGGGVCQVSTTIFRAALNAGLPIIERNAHSYRVSYYEQDSGPGLDATIYSPSVDLQFKNDTEGYILVSSEFNKEDASLKFTIYGKSDGREVEVTKPKILSQTPPPEAKYIEDASLRKGVKKTQEYPIWGAVVSFNRTVKKSGQVLYEDTFKSNYRAWGAVYATGTGE